MQIKNFKDSRVAGTGQPKLASACSCVTGNKLNVVLTPCP